jgi:hypothetical protein
MLVRGNAALIIPAPSLCSGLNAYQRLVELGARIFAPPRLIAPMPTHDLWMAAFHDSEGNIHQLMSEVPRAK